MAKLKATKKELIARAKKRKPDRENYTFRLRADLMEEFKRKVDQSGVKPTAILEELIIEFNKM